MVPTRRWKRVCALGCSHGFLIDPSARDAVVRFIRAFKPHAVVHLGDFCDTTAFRTGAKGTADESQPVLPDIEGGISFLNEIGATLIFNGNHEDRLWRLANHPNAIIAMCATACIQSIEECVAKLKAQHVTDWSVRAWRMIGNVKFMHGYMYNENAARDHAEAHGNVVFAHTHRAQMQKGRRDDNPTGFCVGTLSSIPNMDYAKARRSTLAWSNGFVWGEYCDNESVLWLSEKSQNQKEWRLPPV